VLDRHPLTAVTSLIPALSCHSCRANAPFAELVRLSPMSIADEIRGEHGRRLRKPKDPGPPRGLQDHFAVIWLCRGCHQARHDREPHLLDWGGQVRNAGNPR
jgi:hypothetical protein